MRLVELKDGNPVISVDGDELLFLYSAVLEALHGIGDKEFAARAGMAQDEALSVLKNLGAIGKRATCDGTIRLLRLEGGFSIVHMEVRHLRLIKEAIDVALREIDDWELHARTATNPEDALHIRNDVHHILGQLSQ